MHQNACDEEGNRLLAESDFECTEENNKCSRMLVMKKGTAYWLNQTSHVQKKNKMQQNAADGICRNKTWSSCSPRETPICSNMNVPSNLVKYAVRA